MAKRIRAADEDLGATIGAKGPWHTCALILDAHTGMTDAGAA
jgi:hypothetical protein